jgi:mannose-6-phosphate isomerase-like protein (cupin superfamily)
MSGERVNLRKSTMQQIIAHNGKGTISWSRLIDSQPNSNINFVDRAIIPPNATIGGHFHKGSEEIYFVLSGCGRMTLGESTFMVEPFDIIVNRAGYHGLVNCSDADIEIFVIEVKLPGIKCC